IMNPLLTRLHAYPFERLAQLLSGARPPAGLTPIRMSVGEPQHEPPANVLATLRDNLHRLGTYPTTAGLADLRAACAHWLEKRFRLPHGSVDPATMVLPVNGTREALFAFVQAAVDSRGDPLVLMPNPFYQIYEGAALLADAQPHFLGTTAANGFTPDLDAVPESIWRRCQVLFLCSPGNPAGRVLSLGFLRHALELADRYGFIIAADECYTEIYLDERSPPPGLLEACRAAGRDRFERCVVFHSLSKRSSVPGLRSGFVAGDPQILARFLLYRTYHGSAMAVPTQLASIAAWRDEEYAVRNRQLYREKVKRFLRDLYATQAVTVLPGSYLARADSGTNPGAGRVRISLVPPIEQCVEAAERIREFLRQNPT